MAEIPDFGVIRKPWGDYSVLESKAMVPGMDLQDLVEVFDAAEKEGSRTADQLSRLPVARGINAVVTAVLEAVYHGDRSDTRDIELQPYTPDEQRVVDWLREHTPGVGAGADPIGFVLASYSYKIAQQKAQPTDEDLLVIARAINDGLGPGWAYSNYGGDEWNSMRNELLQAARAVMATITKIQS